MSEYKENTVGWWLSQLKEPLKSRAFGVYSKPEWLDRSAANICDATNILSWTRKGDTAFWDGVDAFFRQDVTREHLYPSRWNGWDMAKECAPDNWLKPKDGGEDKAIVDSPAPEVWGEKIPIGSFESFCKGMDVSSNPYQESVVQGMCERVPIDSWQESQNMGIHSAIRNHPKLGEIEAPQRAVVGYEEPKPIDTIEKKHELRIKNLEARVKQLEDQLFKYLGSKNG